MVIFKLICMDIFEPHPSWRVTRWDRRPAEAVGCSGLAPLAGGLPRDAPQGLARLSVCCDCWRDSRVLPKRWLNPGACTGKDWLQAV